MENGLKDSGIRMNQRITGEDNWGLAQLEERNEYMKNRALEIWTMPVTAFKPSEKQMDAYSLDDDINLSGLAKADKEKGGDRIDDTPVHEALREALSKIE